MVCRPPEQGIDQKFASTPIADCPIVRISQTKLHAYWLHATNLALEARKCTPGAHSGGARAGRTVGDKTREERVWNVFDREGSAGCERGAPYVSARRHRLSMFPGSEDRGSWI